MHRGPEHHRRLHRGPVPHPAGRRRHDHGAAHPHRHRARVPAVGARAHVLAARRQPVRALDRVHPDHRVPGDRAVPAGRLLRLHAQGDPEGPGPQPARRDRVPRAVRAAARRDGDGLRPRRPDGRRARPRRLFGWLRELVGPADAAADPPPRDVGDPRDRPVPRLQLHPRRPHREERPASRASSAASSSRRARRSSSRATAAPSCWSGSSREQPATHPIARHRHRQHAAPRRRRRRPRSSRRSSCLLAARPRSLPAGTRLVDGGTSASTCCHVVDGARGVVLVDAVDMGGPPARSTSRGRRDPAARADGSAGARPGRRRAARASPGSSAGCPSPSRCVGIQVGEVAVGVGLTPAVEAALPRRARARPTRARRARRRPLRPTARPRCRRRRAWRCRMRARLDRCAAAADRANLVVVALLATVMVARLAAGHPRTQRRRRRHARPVRVGVARDDADGPRAHPDLEQLPPVPRQAAATAGLKPIPAIGHPLRGMDGVPHLPHGREARARRRRVTTGIAETECLNCHKEAQDGPAITQAHADLNEPCLDCHGTVAHLPSSMVGRNQDECWLCHKPNPSPPPQKPHPDRPDLTCRECHQSADVGALPIDHALRADDDVRAVPRGRVEAEAQPEVRRIARRVACRIVRRRTGRQPGMAHGGWPTGGRAGARGRTGRPRWAIMGPCRSRSCSSWDALDGLVARLAGRSGATSTSCSRSRAAASSRRDARLPPRPARDPRRRRRCSTGPSGGTHDAPRIGHFPDAALLAGRRVLVVDEVWETGETMTEVMARVRAAGAIPVYRGAPLQARPVAGRRGARPYGGHRRRLGDVPVQGGRLSRRSQRPLIARL